MDPKALGKKIKLARIEADMTQIDFAKKIGSLQKNVSWYENGAVVPSLETMEKIANVLNKTVDHFLKK